MKVVEKLHTFPEPEWILDKTGSGSLYWRRESPEYSSRVKFRVDVEVKEFQRSAHELEEADWCKCINDGSYLTMGLTCILCIAVTVVLPWYVIGST